LAGAGLDLQWLVRSRVLTIPKATPLNAVWYSKLGVGNSGFGYAKHTNRERPAQKDATAKEENCEDTFQLSTIHLMWLENGMWTYRFAQTQQRHQHGHGQPTRMLG
jgi:hypothetical protein